MKKNIFIFIILFFLWISLYLNFLAKNNIDTWSLAKNNIDTWSLAKNNIDTWSLAKNNIDTWSLAKNNIDTWSLAKNNIESIIDEFDKINNKNNFDKFLKKYNWQNLLYTFLRVWNKKLFLKFQKYSFKNKNISLENYENYMGRIFDNYNSKWYFNWKYINNWEYDYFLISLLNKDIKFKLNLCNKWFSNDIESLNACKKYSLFMSYENNNDCNKMMTSVDKKWCIDTLKLIN